MSAVKTYQAEIDATHPMNDTTMPLSMDADAMAMRLVGERHGKRELVDLVRWLVLRSHYMESMTERLVNGLETSTNMGQMDRLCGEGRGILNQMGVLNMLQKNNLTSAQETSNIPKEGVR